MRHLTLTEALESQSSGTGGIGFLGMDGSEREFGYRTLRERALHVLYCLQGNGVQPGDELVLCVSGNLEFVDAFWACLLGGIAPVPLSVGSSKEHRRKVLRVLGTLGRPVLFTERKFLDRLTATADEEGARPQLNATRKVLLDQIVADDGVGRVHGAGPDDVALIQFSSGSTGHPKGVVLTHRNVLSNLRGIGDSVVASSRDSTLSWMPLTHDMGLMGFHLMPLVFGMRQYLMPAESFVRQPLRWLQHAAEKRVTALGCPNFGYRHFLRSVDRSACEALDLSSVRLIFNGAEPIAASVCQAFSDTLSKSGLRADAIFPVYGLAEATLAVAFPKSGTTLTTIHAERKSLRPGCELVSRMASSDHTVSLVSVGHAVGGCEVRIVDDCDRSLTAGWVGRLQIRGDNVTGGYYARAGVNREGFCVDGWLDTGDLGVDLGPAGLCLVGRTKDTLIVNGQTLHASDIEHLCAGASAGLATLACVNYRDADGTDNVVVFVQHRGPLEEFVPVVNRMRHAVRAAAGIDVRDVIPVRSIPRTTSGKIQRFVLREQLSAGAFAESCAAVRTELAKQGAEAGNPPSLMQLTLKNICESVLKDRSVCIHDNLIDSGADSLALVTILHRIEEKYPGLMDVEYFIHYPSIAALGAFLERKLQLMLPQDERPSAMVNRRNVSYPSDAGSTASPPGCF